MGFRLFRRIRIAPGISLNLSKSGGSLSFGRRGARLTVGPRGVRRTVGIPGTGLFYTTTGGGGRRRSSSRRRGTARSRSARGRTSSSADVVAPEVAPEDRLTLGFFRRLVTPADEAAFVDGCREMVRGREAEALEHLRRSSHADGAFLAGMLSLKRKRFAEAIRQLNTAVCTPKEQGRLFAKYGMAAVASLAITDEVTVHVGANTRGILLGLVEAYQHARQWRRALESLDRLRRLEPDDIVVKVSVAEFLMEVAPDRRKAGRRVVRLARGVRNETPIHTALFLYKARALRALGLHSAARSELSTALRRKKGRSPELLCALRYERALAYDALGRRRRARSDLERIYAEAPDYEDVAARLRLAPSRRRAAGARGDEAF